MICFQCVQVSSGVSYLHSIGMVRALFINELLDADTVAPGSRRPQSGKSRSAFAFTFKDLTDSRIFI